MLTVEYWGYQCDLLMRWFYLFLGYEWWKMFSFDYHDLFVQGSMNNYKWNLLEDDTKHWTWYGRWRWISFLEWIFIVEFNLLCRSMELFLSRFGFGIMMSIRLLICDGWLLYYFIIVRWWLSPLFIPLGQCSSIAKQCGMSTEHCSITDILFGVYYNCLCIEILSIWFGCLLCISARAYFLAIWSLQCLSLNNGCWCLLTWYYRIGDNPIVCDYSSNSYVSCLKLWKYIILVAL